MSAVVDILSLVQAYCDTHDEADGHLQQTIWNLTKARRASQSFAALTSNTTRMTASTVRHELNARAMVQIDDAANIGVTECFYPMDPMLINEAASDLDAAEMDAGFCAKDDSTSGLRQRKGKSEASSSKENTTITVETNPSQKTMPKPAAEEALLILGGSLPPRDLRVAQDHARKSLDQYIQAATFVAALQRHLKVANQQ